VNKLYKGSLRVLKIQRIFRTRRDPKIEIFLTMNFKNGGGATLESRGCKAASTPRVGQLAATTSKPLIIPPLGVCGELAPLPSSRLGVKGALLLVGVGKLRFPYPYIPGQISSPLGTSPSAPLGLALPLTPWANQQPNPPLRGGLRGGGGHRASLLLPGFTGALRP
jgi:hypothetical protein